MVGVEVEPRILELLDTLERKRDELEVETWCLLAGGSSSSDSSSSVDLRDVEGLRRF